MEVSSVLGNGFQSLHYFPTTRPVNNSYSIAVATLATPPPALPGRVSTPVSSNGKRKQTQSRSKSTNGSSNISENLSPLQKTKEAAILDIQHASELESALLRSGEVLRVQDLNVVLRHFGKLNRWKDACQLFDWMRQHGKTNIASYSSYLKFASSNSHSVKALEVYSSIEDDTTRGNVSVCNSTLYCLIKSGKFDSSLKLFNQMKQAGLIPDIVTYSTLLLGCAKVRGGYFKAMELVCEIKSRGLPMDVVLYGTLISVCASNNQCEEAEKYFDEMKNENHSPNVFHYSSLLNAYAIDGNYEKADKLIQEMRSAGLTLNKVILTTLLKVYVKSGLFEKSRELLDELQSLGYAEDEMPYCLLMDGLAKSGKIVEARLVFDEMRQKNVKNDGYSYSIMISALCRCGQIEEAKQLAGEFETKYDKYDVVILNTMLCAYCRSGEIENVMKMMKKMDESAISPDWNTFKILIKYFCKEQLYLLAYHTMEDMHSKGHQPQEFSVQSRTAPPSPQLQLRHRDLVRDEVTFGLLTAMISRFCTSNSGCGSSLCSRCSMGSIGKYAASFSSNRARQHRNEVRLDDGWSGQRPQQKGHRQQYWFYPQGLRTTRYFHQDWVFSSFSLSLP